MLEGFLNAQINIPCYLRRREIIEKMILSGKLPTEC